MVSFRSKRKGFTFVEVIISATLFSIIGVGFYQVYTSVIETSNNLRLKNIALFIANSEIEYVRNVPYEDVGLVGGIPSGVFDQYATVTMNGIDFSVVRTIRAIDEPFDGTIGGLPEDLSPADNKMVEVEVGCPDCTGFNPVTLTFRVGPPGLETSSGNGALLVQVFDAGGEAVQGARVDIANDAENPPISFIDTTNDSGELLIVDAPPGTETYRIIVTKDGYSTERTYAAGEDGVLNPVKPNLTVASSTLAQASFAIDLVSDLSFSVITPACAPVPDFAFQMTGSKLLSEDPDLLKYDEAHQTNAAGILTVEDVEWDTYTFTSNDESYVITGMTPLNPASVNPGDNEAIVMIAEPEDPYMVSVLVVDDTSGAPISDAAIQMTGPGGYDNTLNTGVGVVSQTDWSGGPGQADFADSGRFYAQADLDYTSDPGEVHLIQVGSSPRLYDPITGWLESSTFDLGETGELRSFSWSPLNQSGKKRQLLEFQIATNNDNETWSFLGPDGTAGTYYDYQNLDLYSGHAGDRYLRYRAVFTTLHPKARKTPYLSDVYIGYTAECAAPGQVTFSGLTQTGDYDIDVTKSGYQAGDAVVTVDGDTIENITVRLIPN